MQKKKFPNLGVAFPFFFASVQLLKWIGPTYASLIIRKEDVLIFTAASTYFPEN